MNFVTIEISIGEALDRLSILNIKLKNIKNSEKRKDIINDIKSLEKSCDTIELTDWYNKIYDINEKIWIMSDDIRDNVKNMTYIENLTNIHKLNDQRFTIKSEINSLSNSLFKEHKSYKNNVILYLCGGKLGDFIHLLYVVKKMYQNTGKKGILYLTNQGDHFSDINLTYNEMIPIIKEQDYIEELNLGCDEVVGHCFDLTDWRNSKQLYKTNWLDLLSKHYELYSYFKPIKWLNINSGLEFNDVIVVHHNKGHVSEFLKNILNKNKCVFISCDPNEYNNFESKNLVSFYHCKDLYDMMLVINGCKFFIGVQSSPLVMATGLEKPRLAQLCGLDSNHYIGIENYDKKFFWFMENDSNINHINGLENFLIN